MKRDFIALREENTAALSADFSNRFNQLLDLCDIEIPPLNGGRISFLADILDASKPATMDWLTNNKIPKEATLGQIVEFFLGHIEGGESILPARVVSWLRYGEAVSPYPFQPDAIDITQQKLTPLAANIIVTQAKILGLSASDYHLEPVLSLTIKTLIDFEINQLEQFSSVHGKLIQQHIKDQIKD